MVLLLPGHEEARISQCVSSAFTMAEKAGGLLINS